MTLPAGTRIGSYEVTSQLGAGGMGEVYRARDSKLGRDVALKVLPEEYAQHPDRLLRFRREAHALATLNHPSIGAIYGLEESSERTALILELVEGDTLADHLHGGALGWREALPIARQIAEALEAAHEKGILHRDLKPANVKITPDGRVKVLDFGLAKILIDPPAEDLNPSQSPTMMTARSMPGTVLGTAAYMSPEQARGKAVDRRADIWALGCVLYEMLAGKPAFPGDSVSEIIAGVIRGEPDWSQLPPDLPRRVRDLVQRCLRKDPRQRIHDAADVRIEIVDVLARSDSAELAPVAQPRQRSRLLGFALASIAGAAAASAGWWVYAHVATVPVKALRLAVPVLAETGSMYGHAPYIVLSPDGQTVAYLVFHGGTSQLALRSLHNNETTLVAGTEGAGPLFFSPDGQWVGFANRSQLKKVPVTGGSPTAICDIASAGDFNNGFVGGSWDRDGRIVFVPGWQAGLWSVPSTGGAPQLLLDTNLAKEQNIYRDPQVLPNGKGILFTIGTARISSFDDALIAVLEPGAKEPRIVAQGGTSARYLPTGHLVYVRNGTVLAVRFDLSHLQTIGTPVPVLNDVAVHPGGGNAQYSVADDGTLAYLSGGAVKGDSNLVLVDRKGDMRTISRAPGFFGEATITSDGQRIAVRMFAANDDLWTVDISEGLPLRLTSEPGDEIGPVWTPDGRHVAFSRILVGTTGIFWKAADGTGAVEELSSGRSPRYPGSFSPDGNTLAFTEESPTKHRDIWTMSIAGDRQAKPLLATDADEWAPRFSRDGRWIAYVSNETGRDEVYVRASSGGGGRKPVSTDGGVWPVWSHRRSEIFYLYGNKLMSATIDPETGSRGQVGLVTELKFSPLLSVFDVMPDDEHFLMTITPGHPPPTYFNVVLNWFDDLRRLVPTR